MKRKETVQVIGELISDWIIPFCIDSVVDNSDGTYTLNVPKPIICRREKIEN